MSPKSVRPDEADPAPGADAFALGFLVDGRLVAVDLVDAFLAMICAPLKVIRQSMLTLSGPRSAGPGCAPAARGSIAPLRRAIVNNRHSRLNGFHTSGLFGAHLGKRTKF